MMYTIDYSTKSQEVILKWKKSNPNLFKKLKKIVNDMICHPREGIGHPEPLVGGNSITYSRHLDAHRRIVYDVYDDTISILVIELDGHYNDK